MQNKLKQTRTQAWLLIASPIIALTGTLVGSLTGGPLLYLSAAFWLIMSVTRIVQTGKSISIRYTSIIPNFFHGILPYAVSPPKILLSPKGRVFDCSLGGVVQKILDAPYTTNTNF